MGGHFNAFEPQILQPPTDYLEFPTGQKPPDSPLQKLLEERRRRRPYRYRRRKIRFFKGEYDPLPPEIEALERKGRVRLSVSRTPKVYPRFPLDFPAHSHRAVRLEKDLYYIVEKYQHEKILQGQLIKLALEESELADDLFADAPAAFQALCREIEALYRAGVFRKALGTEIPVAAKAWESGQHSPEERRALKVGRLRYVILRRLLLNSVLAHTIENHEKAFRAYFPNLVAGYERLWRELDRMGISDPNALYDLPLPHTPERPLPPSGLGRPVNFPQLEYSDPKQANAPQAYELPLIPTRRQLLLESRGFRLLYPDPKQQYTLFQKFGVSAFAFSVNPQIFKKKWRLHDLRGLTMSQLHTILTEEEILMPDLFRKAPLYRYRRKIILVQQFGLQAVRFARHPSFKLKLAKFLYEQGVQFFVPVHLNTKRQAWYNHGRITPVRFETLEKLVYKKRKVKHTERRAYDLAVRTGTRCMTDPYNSHVLIVLDVDNPKAFQENDTMDSILGLYPTFTVWTGKGFHYYYWVPRQCASNYSKAGVADWLGRGKAAVLTGARRMPMGLMPITRLPKAIAEQIINYMLRKPKPTPPRWGITARINPKNVGDKQTETPALPSLHHLTEKFRPQLGSRNAEVSRMVFRHRHRFTSELEMIRYAQKLAAQCSPPYPPKEAEYIARSIWRHRKRHGEGLQGFVRLRGKYRLPREIATQAPYQGDFRYVRLAQAFPAQHAEFTRADYEAVLEKQGWQRDKRGHIEAARLDIDYALKRGDIVLAGKRPSGKKGGRPIQVYRRVKAYQGGQNFILPGKMTHKNLRQSMFLFLLTPEPMEVARRTMARWLNLRSPASITRYGRELAASGLLNRKIQQPYLNTPYLNPRFHGVKEWPLPRALYYQLREFMLYRPTIYSLTPRYFELFKLAFPHEDYPQSPEDVEALQEKRMAQLGRDIARKSIPVQAVKPRKSLGDKPPSDLAIALSERQYNERQRRLERERQAKARLEAEQALPPPHEATCEHCQNVFSAQKDPFCPSCAARRDASRARRLAIPETVGEPPYEDFCEKCHNFFDVERWPLTGICPACEAEHFPNSVTYRVIFCPNCNHRSVMGEFNRWKPLQVCPHCESRVKRWLYLPKERANATLIGAPINEYLPEGLPLFQLMTEAFRRFGKRKLYELYTPEQVAGWGDYYRQVHFVDVPCAGCGQMVNVDERQQSEKQYCPTCLTALTPPIPKIALDLLHQEESRQNASTILFLIHKLYPKPDLDTSDVASWVSKYRFEWVETAVLVNSTKKLYHPIPYLGKVLENWAKQDHINRSDREQAHAIRVRNTLQLYKIPADKEEKLVRKMGSIYHAYHFHIALLNRESALALTQAALRFGEESIYFAIEEAVKNRVRNWGYCVQILLRLEREKKTKISGPHYIFEINAEGRPVERYEPKLTIDLSIQDRPIDKPPDRFVQGQNEALNAFLLTPRPLDPFEGLEDYPKSLAQPMGTGFLGTGSFGTNLFGTNPFMMSNMPPLAGEARRMLPRPPLLPSEWAELEREARLGPLGLGADTKD
jgi:hypothetical protein